MKRLSRRTALRGLLATGAAITIPLPVLDIMLNDNGTALASGTPLTRRYVTWFFGNGILPPLWVPAATGTGSNWALSEQLMPLASVKDWLTVVSGLGHTFSSGLPHPTGSAAATTGADIANKSAQLASIDQIVAGVNKGGSFSSLEIGVSNASPEGGQNTLHAISHRGANAPNYPEFDPHAVFTRLFASSTGTATSGMTAAQVASHTAAKKSILDAIVADGNEMNKLLGANDQQRLTAHLDAIRDIETRLTATPVASTVTTPTDPTKQGILQDKLSEAPANVNEVMANMLAVALASDITRNASFVFTLPAAHVYYRTIGANMDADFHNTICHTDPGDDAHQTRVDTGVNYAMTALNVFLSKLASMKEGAGTVLDNSLVYITSDISWGKVHTTTEWPVLLAGKAGGAFKGNQHSRFAGDNLSKVLLTIANAMGANLKNIGLGSGLVTSELTGLRVTT